MHIIGISAFYHDSAVALISDGDIVAAAQEERFTRIKHDSGFPFRSLKFVLDYSKMSINDIDAVVFYDKPFLKIERLFETYATFAPKGVISFLASIPVIIKEKLFLKERILKELSSFNLSRDIDILFGEHHLSHAASAFYPSPFEEAAILTVDGVGEYATTTIGIGKGKNIEILKELHFPHSLGLLYSAFTYYTGFKVNSGEYKLMGLAPYGEPRFVDLIKNELVDIKEDGSLMLNMKYFGFATSLKMINGNFERLFGKKARKPESEITRHEMDVAASIQAVTDEIMLKLANYAYRITQSKNLVLSGGVALNCVANGKILRESPFENMWIQPAASDAGGALGAALSYYYLTNENSKRQLKNGCDSMKGAFLGPEFSDEEAEKILSTFNAVFERYEDFDRLCEVVAALIEQKRVIGWFQGRMEFGPRALGARSILGDPRDPEMQRNMNLKIKFRESFRPFAPAVLSELRSEYFDIDVESPYMLLVANVSERHRISTDKSSLVGLDKLKVIRSDIPAVTHIDYSARIQTVNKDINPRFYTLLRKFYEISKTGVMINTSFNIRGEPIVCTPADAYVCFMKTNIDYLVIGNLLLDKKRQPPLVGYEGFISKYELD